MLLSLFTACSFADGHYVNVPAGVFHRAIALDDSAASAVVVPSFRMRTKLVTNAEFLAFVRREPDWRRDRIAAVFANPGYLSQWDGPLSLGTHARPGQPVTRVNWFAARAFCASEGGRLPNWIEWEYVAASDAQHRDARHDAGRQQRLLVQLTATFGAAPITVAGNAPNVYGLYDVHALLAEWVGDYAALFVNDDARSPDGEGQLRFCGGTALAFVDRTDYSLMMRVAALAALSPADGSTSVGFRCVKDNHNEGKS
jgi:formylglycine-generating enzyme required for sulfatase activity